MTPLSAREHFAAAVRHTGAGDARAAEAAYRAGLAIAPDNAAAALSLGILLLRQGATSDAETFVRRAVAQQRSVQGLTVLAEILAATSRDDDAAPLYRELLDGNPQYVPALLGLARVHERRGEMIEAGRLHKRAWEADPQNIDSAIAHAVSCSGENLPETAALMDRLLKEAQGDEPRQLKILQALLPYKEFHARQQRGLAPHHATGLDELFFKYAADDFALYRDIARRRALQRPTDGEAIAGKLIASFCMGDRVAAQACLSPQATTGGIWDAITFDPAVLRACAKADPKDVQRQLPAVRDVIASDVAAENVLFVSANESYFSAFGKPLLRSLAAVGTPVCVHVHIMDATDTQLADAASFCRGLSNLTVALTGEQTGVPTNDPAAARAYYHAIRFVRFYQLLLRYGRTVWMMDVDALFNGAPDALYAMIGEADTAFRVRAGRFEPWNQFSAQIVGVKPTAAGQRYLRLVASYIAHFHGLGRLRWGIDQAALYSAFMHLQDEGVAPALACLNERAIDLAYRDDGIVWCNAGTKKFRLFQPHPSTPDSSRREDRYRLRFDGFRTPG